MAVNINILNAGNMTLGSGGSERDYSKTRLQWSNDESDYDDYLIEGLLSINSLENFNIYFDGSCDIYKIEIGNAVTSIYQSAFYCCSGLTYVTIPDSVTSIGDYAFYNCTSMMSVTIPNSVTSIGDGAFGGCSNLTTITVLGKTTSDAQTLLANAGVPAGCTIIGELG